MTWYKFLTVNDDLPLVHEMGKIGWQLISVVRTDNGMSCGAQFAYFLQKTCSSTIGE